MGRTVSALNRSYVRLTGAYCLLQGVYWIIDAVAMSYATPILEARGFSGTQIGVISGGRFLSLMGFQFVLGAFVDRKADKIPLKHILSVLTILAVFASVLLLTSSDNFLIAFFVFLLFGATINCLLPLIESLSIRYMDSGRTMNYPLSRATGSLTYCLACALTGLMTERWGLGSAIGLMIGMLLVFEMVNLRMPPEGRENAGRSPDPKQGSRSGERFLRKAHSTGWVLIHCRAYRWFLVECFLIFAGYDLNMAFLIDKVRDAGGGNREYGFIFAAVGLAEIPTALLFHKIRRHLSIRTLMAGFGVFSTLRALATTGSGSCGLMMVSQLLDAPGMGVFYAGSVYFVMETVPEEDSTKGMSLINLIAVGAANAVAYILAGILKDAFGLMPLMWISCIVSAAGIIFGGLMWRSRQ
ncbi:MAG: MFS transporter [Chordicoccus sp.]